MRIRPISAIVILLIGLLIIGFFISIGCSSQSSINTSSEPTKSQLETSLPAVEEPAPDQSITSLPSKEINSSRVPTNPVSVVIAGYINHGPMQPTVRAIKEVLSKYGDKVSVTWIDLATTQGQSYFKEHGLTAHMNVIINGTSRYQVDGKIVDFQWFEGQQWTKIDLDAALANLINK
jgi:hypothetical protein